MLTTALEQYAILWKIDLHFEFCLAHAHCIFDDTSTVRTAVFSPDGTSVLTTSWNGTVKLFCARCGTCTTTFTCHAWPYMVPDVHSAVFSPDGTYVLTTSNDYLCDSGTAQIWNIASGECTTRINFDTGSIDTAVFSP